ncbi:YidB family protein [Noviherbaspirillum sp.]|uniref:YidB family protein n=1 Tax=Noviherbaspirillum sp. TaxID=1926288 RepID=UPI002FE14781
MGYLDHSVGAAGGGQPYLFNTQTRLLQAALSLLANNGQTGGLSGLTERFQNAGLGNVMRSWISQGPNMPISGEEIEMVLGDGHLQQLAEETGLPQNQAAHQLSEMLPGLVDKLTPNGKAPHGGLGDLGFLLGEFMAGQT